MSRAVIHDEMELDMGRLAIQIFEKFKKIGPGIPGHL